MSMIKYAEMFARGAHAGQKHGDRPYWKHLQEVSNQLRAFGLHDHALYCAAWLHDTIEDTPTTYQDLKQLFGEDVAELVWAVTDEMGRNRKERKKKTWPKIAASPDAIVLKLADTAANIFDAFKKRSKLCQMYVKEWPEIRSRFHEALDGQNEYLTEVLRQIDGVILAHGSIRASEVGIQFIGVDSSDEAEFEVTMGVDEDEISGSIFLSDEMWQAFDTKIKEARREYLDA